VVDTLVIDDIEAISWNKKQTQQMIKKIQNTKYKYRDCFVI
jgi:hypothetical protein